MVETTSEFRSHDTAVVEKTIGFRHDTAVVVVGCLRNGSVGGEPNGERNNSSHSPACLHLSDNVNRPRTQRLYAAWHS